MNETTMTYEQYQQGQAEKKRTERAKKEAREAVTEGPKFEYHLSNQAEYVKNRYDAEKNAFKKTSTTKTGYANVDKILNGMAPGLYILGAPPAVGKTTWLSQLADSVAQQERDVIYFTLEQSELELASKSIARLHYQRLLRQYGEDSINDDVKLKEHARTALQIRKQQGADTEDARNEYAKIGEHKYIAALDYNATVIDIRTTLSVSGFLNSDIPAAQRPVVIIDYLQALSPIDPRLSLRETVNQSMEAIKSMQKEYGLIVWLISSYNRTGYYQPVSLESMKESGGVEFTGDFVAGLQLHAVVDDGIGAHEKPDLNEVKSRVNDAMEKNVRDVDFVCVKNRFGSPFTASFYYDAAYDCFIPKMSVKYERKAGTRDIADMRKELQAADKYYSKKKK